MGGNVKIAERVGILRVACNVHSPSRSHQRSPLPTPFCQGAVSLSEPRPTLSLPHTKVLMNLWGRLVAAQGTDCSSVVSPQTRGGLGLCGSVPRGGF